jgi:hypothetical protein
MPFYRMEEKMKSNRKTITGILIILVCIIFPVFLSGCITYGDDYEIGEAYTELISVQIDEGAEELTGVTLHPMVAEGVWEQYGSWWKKEKK